MDNYQRLKRHIDGFIERKHKQWAGLPADRGLKSHLHGCLNKWRALFNDNYLKDDRFLNIAEPFTDRTVIEPCQYYMRGDGSIVFVEMVFVDQAGELIAGHPLRFPHVREARARYLSHNIEPDIFGIEMKCITRVIHNGRKDYGKQTEESFKIIAAQKNTRFPILPIYFHRRRVGREEFSISQTPVFRRENFVAHFPFAKALNYMYHGIKFEPIVKGTDWLIHQSSKLPFADFAPLRYEDLGVTGSSSFGDTHDKEDFDVVFRGPIESLRKYGRFLDEGVKRRAFRPVSANRKLRVYLDEIPIACNQGAPLLLCSFMNLKNIREDWLYRSQFNILGRIEHFEARVSDDGYNMVNPPRVRVANFRNVRCKKGFWLHDGIPLIPMMGTSRGLYQKGRRLVVRNAMLVEFTPEWGHKFKAIVSTGWYDIDIVE